MKSRFSLGSNISQQVGQKSKMSQRRKIAPVTKAANANASQKTSTMREAFLIPHKPYNQDHLGSEFGTQIRH
jgi:hypothetical protein